MHRRGWESQSWAHLVLTLEPAVLLRVITVSWILYLVATVVPGACGRRDLLHIRSLLPQFTSSENPRPGTSYVVLWGLVKNKNARPLVEKLFKILSQ